jgi:radical SAM protein with 4Fe4S-binding SPASM domain
MLPTMVLGRIGQDPLEKVWQEAPALKALQDRVSIPLERFEECRDCDYRATCTGNCPALAWSLGGDAFRPSEDACLKRFLGQLAAEGLDLWQE